MAFSCPIVEQAHETQPLKLSYHRIQIIGGLLPRPDDHRGRPVDFVPPCSVGSQQLHERKKRALPCGLIGEHLNAPSLKTLQPSGRSRSGSFRDAHRHAGGSLAWCFRITVHDRAMKVVSAPRKAPAGLKRMIDTAHGCALQTPSSDVGEYGQSVDLLLKSRHVHNHVAAQHVDEMIAADANESPSW